MKWYGHWKKDKWQAGRVTGGRELTYYAKGPGFNPQNHKRQTNKQKNGSSSKVNGIFPKGLKGEPQQHYVQLKFGSNLSIER